MLKITPVLYSREKKYDLGSEVYANGSPREILAYEQTQNYRWQRAANVKNGTAPASRSLRKYAAKKKSRAKAALTYDTAGEFRKFDAPFVAWDGEGHTLPDGRHVYTMLANNLGDVLHDEQGIRLIAALDFLCNIGKRNPRTNHVSFAFGYDVNMLLRDLPEDKLRELNDNGREQTTIMLNNRIYWLRYRRRKFFSISRSVNDKFYRKTAKGTYERNVETTIIIYDTFGFFQRSFVRALTEYFATDEAAMLPELATIRSMKDKRGGESWASERYADVLRYCRIECEYLVVLMDRLRGYLKRCGFIIRSWDGTGAVARHVLAKYRVRDYMQPTSADLWDIVKRSYSGGRIEACAIGRSVDTVFDYDVNSAYPSAMVDLPCLRCGTWRYVPPGERPTQRVCLTRVRAAFADGQPWYPLWKRTLDGEIRYSRTTHGWYWQHEVEAAERFDARTRPYRKNTPDVFFIREEAWEYVSACEHKPFGFVADLYAVRQEMRLAGEPAHAVLKLALNSLYGKLCQQLGGTDERLPPFFQLEWAAMITSATRAKLIDAALSASHLSDIIFFATDGILSKSHLAVSTSDNPDVPVLGGWDLKGSHGESIIVGAGIYWLRNADGTWTVASRGVEVRDAAAADLILETWRANKDSYESWHPKFWKLGECLLSETINPKWNTWTVERRTNYVDGESGKRVAYRGDFTLLADRLVTLDLQRTSWELSEPHSIHFWADGPYGKRSALAFRLGEDGLEEDEAS